MENGLDIVSYKIGKKHGGVQPTGEIDITQNGVANVSGYATANVQVPEPSGKINITQNGTDIDVSSYATADVSVELDLSDYFNSTISEGSWGVGSWTNTIKKIPDLTSTGTSLQYAFYGFPNSIAIPKINISNCVDFRYFFTEAKKKNIDLSSWTINIPEYQSVNFSQFIYNTPVESIDFSSLGTIKTNSQVQLSYMFAYNSSLKTIDLSNFYVNNNYNTTCGNMFDGCSSLEKLDMSSFDFAISVGFTSGMFNNVPANCLILVKDQTQKDWFTTNFSNLTNVQIKSQYISNQGA